MNKLFHLYRTELSYIAVCAVFLLITTSSVNAEIADIGLNFTLMSPQGEFGDTVDRNGYGVSFEGVYHPSVFPIGIGLELGFINYGKEDRKEPLTSTIPDMRVRVDNDNNILAGNILFRYKPEVSVIRPYIDGIIGIKYLYTSTYVRGDHGESFLSSNNYDDIAFSYGVGGGFMLPVYRLGKSVKQKGNVEFFLDFKVRYMIGEEADYLKEGSIIRSGSDVSYDIYRSKTDMLLFHLGVAISFSQ
ncbi:hypothetical protein ACFL1R_09785 [Candidatus Latescibacterota bacterium]